MLKSQNEQDSYWEKTHIRSPEDRAVEAYVMPKIKFILRNIQLNNREILDVGCGNGYFTHHFFSFGKVCGADISLAMLNKNTCKKLTVASAECLPFKDNSFDIVFEANMLHHDNNPGNIITEMRRVSREYVVLLEQNNLNPLMFLFSLIVKEERGGLKFNRNYLRHLVKNKGLAEIASIVTGMISPNKTPDRIIPALKIFDRDFMFGEYAVLILKKM